MHKHLLTLAAAVVMIGGASLLGAAQAAPTGLPDGARAAVERFNMVEAVHSWRGQNYCWYEGGWNGAGWYQCGYAGRKGHGWGGPYGWHGWGAPMWGHRMGWSGHHMRGCCW